MLNCLNVDLIIFEQTPSNKKIEVMTVASNYHIEVNPNDAGIYDRIVIQEMIKNIAQAQQLDIGGQREFKGIFPSPDLTNVNFPLTFRLNAYF